jgi:hypothetical protein
VSFVRRALFALAALLLAAGPASLSPCAVAAEGFARGCCKTCSAGKACGDSCIARSKTCHKGKGCACNG